MTPLRAIVHPDSSGPHARWQYTTADGSTLTGFHTPEGAATAAERAGYSPHIYRGVAAGRKAVAELQNPNRLR